jgi:hypothetical protein
LGVVNIHKDLSLLNYQSIFELKLVYIRQSSKPFVPITGTDKDDASKREAVQVVWHEAIATVVNVLPSLTL